MTLRMTIYDYEDEEEEKNNFVGRPMPSTLNPQPRNPGP